MAAEHGGKTRYREPLFGYARADDPRWQFLRDTHVPGHLLPSEVLPGAQSVACFFLPFEADLVRANAVATVCAAEWGTAYVETNALLTLMCAELERAFAREGVAASWQQPTHNYDPVSLRARWSHKSAAVIAGMGEIGLHQMLITERGCAGRVSSIVVAADLARGAAGRSRPSFCGYFAGASCSACVERCPVGALTTDGLRRDACRDHLKVVGEYLVRHCSVPEPLDICGKCCTGPCALAPWGPAATPGS
jgi:epoxyqueuosine reductase QueG